MTEILPQIETQSQISDAIADAIMVSFASQIRKYHERKPFVFSSDDPVEAQAGNERWRKVLKESIQDNCSFNSIIAGIYLADNYAHLFKQMVIVQSQLKGEHTFSQPFRRGTWSSHAGLVLNDTLGNWHYVTPANDLNIEHRPHFISRVFEKFSQKPESNPLLTHLVAPTLTQLMAQIEQLETRAKATLWPTASEIQHFAQLPQNEQFTKPSPGQKKIVTIYKNWVDKIPETID